MSTVVVDERIRLTVSLPPSVHAAFARLAKVSGSSIGREIGDFLAETVEAVEFTASKMEQARDAPRLAMREMHAYALGLADETGQILQTMRGHRVKGIGASSEPATPEKARRRPSPPPSNTGGKVPNTGAQKRRPLKGSR